MTDEGGWTVIQRKKTNSVSFDHTWDEYKAGFGELAGDHWLGNWKIHAITVQGSYAMKDEMTRHNGGKYYNTFSSFGVGDEASKYILQVGSHIPSKSSGEYDAWTARHNGLMFTTTDNDNDESSAGNCAANSVGFWYQACHHITINKPICALSVNDPGSCQGKYVNTDPYTYENANGFEVKIKQM